MNQFVYKIAFSMVRGMKPAVANEIINRLGSEQEFFTLPRTALQSRLEFNGSIIDNDYRAELLEKARLEMEFIESNHIECRYFTDSDYPARLLECEDAPLLLYGTGNTDLNAAHMVSIVGTRNATAYGVNFINTLVDELARKIDGLVIVSGLATGCDITAHRRAMQAGVPTIGIVAHGLDTLYPAEHRNYAAQMVRSGGMILTDYPHGTRPHRGNFLARNRIVAGISDCVVVAESAAQRGGALHTAKVAMLYNRDVFALPGRTSDLYSGGCNALIRSNTAHLIENADDLIHAMCWTPRPAEGQQATMFPELTGIQQDVVDYLRQNGEAQTNRMAIDLGIPVGQLMATLVELEFNGMLLSLPGARYRLA